jgi:signal transduction histidine kinase
VLINLVQNAAESIEGPGRVTLRAYDGPGPNADDQRKAIVLEVEDTGSGISPEVQERLFDPFFSTKENGTGLGLPIAAKIVDQHKGRLEFETRSDQGAIFRVILPADGELKSNA